MEHVLHRRGRRYFAAVGLTLLRRGAAFTVACQLGLADFVGCAVPWYFTRQVISPRTRQCDLCTLRPVAGRRSQFHSTSRTRPTLVDKPAHFGSQLVVFRCTKETAVRHGFKDVQFDVDARLAQGAVHPHGVG
jgi:hypothetical protein